MPQINLPRPPRNAESFGREIWTWFNLLHKRLTDEAQILWDQIDKATSSLADLGTADHSDLTSIGAADDTSSDVVQDKHISNFQAKTWKDNDAKEVNPTDTDTTRDKHVSNGDLKDINDALAGLNAEFGTSATFTPVYKGATSAGANVGTYDGSYYTVGSRAFVDLHIDQTTNTGGVGTSYIDISNSSLAQVTTDTPAICEVMAVGLANVCSACSIVGKMDSNSSIIRLYTSHTGDSTAIDVDTGACEMWLSISFEI